MPGDEWQRFANARAFLAYMWAHPGKKLLFMGPEIGQREEWNHDAGIRWELLQFDLAPQAAGAGARVEPALSREPGAVRSGLPLPGFEWVDFHDVENSIIAFLRRAEDREDFLLFCCNFTPVPRTGYDSACPRRASTKRSSTPTPSCSAARIMGNGGLVSSRPIPRHNREHSISVTLPPLAVVAFRKRS